MGMTVPIADLIGRNRSLSALMVLTACVVLLAGCGASLQSELTPDVGQHKAASASPVNESPGEKVVPVTTSSTGAPMAEPVVVVGRADRKADSLNSATDSAALGSGAPPVRKAALSGPREALADAEPAVAAVRLPAAAASLTAMTEPGHTAYRIGPLDVLTVTVFRVPELSAEVQVADTGTINLPLIGDVMAVGRTAKDVEMDVAARLGEKYLQNPQVTVFIKEYNAQRVTVNGAVKKPGVFPLKGRTTLLQLISMAEGLDHNRASSNVVVFREMNGKRTAARFDLDEIHEGIATDPILEPGDVVIVDDSAAKVVLHNVLRVLPVTNVFMGVF